MITIIRKRHHISTEPAPASLAAAQASLLDLLFKVPAEGLQNDSYLDHVLHGPKTNGVDMRGHPGFPWMLGSRIGILSSHKSHFLFKTLMQPPQSQEQLDPDERSMSFFRRLHSPPPLPTLPTFHRGLQWNVHTEASLAHIQRGLDLGGQSVAHQHHHLTSLGWRNSDSNPIQMLMFDRLRTCSRVIPFGDTMDDDWNLHKGKTARQNSFKKGWKKNIMSIVWNKREDGQGQIWWNDAVEAQDKLPHSSRNHLTSEPKKKQAAKCYQVPVTIINLLVCKETIWENQGGRPNLPL